VTTTDRQRSRADAVAAVDDEPGALDGPAADGLDGGSAHVVRRLTPEGRSLWADLVELWTARELVAFLTVRDLKVRYKQTVLGAAWALLQPAATMAVFYVFFRKLSDAPGGVPYSLFALAALVPWTFFANALSSSSLSLVEDVDILSKVYFPRLAIPIASVLAGLVDLGLSFVLLMIFTFGHGYAPTVEMLAVVPMSLIAIAAAAGLACLLSALSVEYRDFRYVVPFTVQLWLFATPVAYASTVISQPWRTVAAINPMVGVVAGFRWAVLGVEGDVGSAVLVSSISAVVMCALGIWWFHHREPVFADVA
jgi:lipopolysaccharide transport system permease protein